MRAYDIWDNAEALTGGDVLAFMISLVGPGIDALDAQ